jgi:hypothetical protein
MSKSMIADLMMAMYATVMTIEELIVTVTARKPEAVTRMRTEIVAVAMAAKIVMMIVTEMAESRFS